MMLHDFRSALRGLRRDWRPAALAVMLLATGAGAAAAIYGVVGAYLLRPLPYPESERIVSIRWAVEEGQRSPSADELAQVDLSALPQVLESATAWDLDAFTLTGGEASELALGAWVDPAYFEVLGVAPALGRALDRGDTSGGSGNVAVISHGLWQRRFGGASDVLGQDFLAYVSDRPEEAESFTVVGVMPANHWPFLAYSEILAPLRETGFPYLGRLAPGIEPKAAAEILTNLVGTHLGNRELGRVTLQPLHERHVAAVRPLLVVLMASSVLVLLIAAGNVGLLLFVRNVRRRRELAIRSVLGAGRGRLLLQLVLEALLLCGAASILALLLAALTLGGLDSLIEDQLGRSAPGGNTAIRLDLVSSVVVILACSLLGVGLGLATSLVLPRRQLATSLRGGPGSTQSGRHQLLRNSLVAGEIALSLGLLVTAGLTVRSALHLGDLDLGFEPEGVLIAGVGLRAHSYPQAEHQALFAGRLHELLRALPEVEAVSLSSPSPFGPRNGTPIQSDRSSTEPPLRAAVRSVTPGLLDALDIQLLAGRAIEAGDRYDTEPVALVSSGLARRLWPDASPVGRRIRVGGSTMAMAEGGGTAEVWRRVVGVAADLRETLVGDDLGDVYLPLSQSPSLWMSVVLESKLSDPLSAVPRIREALATLDRDVPLTSIGLLGDQVARETLRGRFLASVLTAFAVFALLLGLVGLYGVVSQAAIQRRRETAIRLALGAAPGRVVRLFLFQALATLVGGGVLGLGVSLLLSRALAGQLHGIDTTDPMTWIVVPALLGACALFATWLPAREAARAEPMKALRSD